MSKKNVIKYRNFNQIISHAPGPSPHYLLSKGPKITSKYGTLCWRDGRDNKSILVTVYLTTPTKEPLAIFGYDCYVLQMEDNKFVVWYDQEQFRGMTSLKISNPSIQIIIIDVR